MVTVICVDAQCTDKNRRLTYLVSRFTFSGLQMSDFLAANNPCGQNLLQLVATGNAIIAELLRLADFVPPLFKVASIRDAGKYADIIYDFSYFSKQEYYDDLINGRAVRRPPCDVALSGVTSRLGSSRSR